ncbi:hypothetical protein EV191_1406, partial [Tamaricihabitans halophyticus]
AHAEGRADALTGARLAEVSGAHPGTARKWLASWRAETTTSAPTTNAPDASAPGAPSAGSAPKSARAEPSTPVENTQQDAHTPEGREVAA